MSEIKNKTVNQYSKLRICLFPGRQTSVESLAALLNNDRYEATILNCPEELIEFVKDEGENVDCLILLRNLAFNSIIKQLSQLNILLPIVIVEKTGENSENSNDLLNFVLYHSAEVRLYPIQLEQINSFINLAISRFLHLSPSCSLSDRSVTSKNSSEIARSEWLLDQQRRLTEKLKERLGYLGVYYKRNSKNFYRHLSEAQKEDLLKKLVADYSEIILGYFADNSQANQYIDKFVNRAFLLIFLCRKF